MPPQAYDPTAVSIRSHTMDHPNHHQQQQQQQQHPHMYPTYNAYAAPTYHGHTGYSYANSVPPPPPPAGGYNSMGMYGYPTAPPPPPPPPADYAPVKEQVAVTAAAPSPAYEVILPHENDVLMGRGGKNNQHVGNERLRDMARAIRDRYKACTKKGKSNMSRDLVQEVRELTPPGRFLKRNPVTGEWEDVGDEIAREKVSQVLRDAVSEWCGPKAEAAEAAKEKEGGAVVAAVVPGDVEKEEIEAQEAVKKAAAAATEAPPSALVKKETQPTPTPPPTPASTSRSTSPDRNASPAPAPAPMPVINVPVAVARTVTETVEKNDVPGQSTSPLPPPPPSPTDITTPTARMRINTADSDISFTNSDDVSLPGTSSDDVSLPDEFVEDPAVESPLDESSDSHSASAPRHKKAFRRMPVQHVPFTSFRKSNRKPNVLDRYSYRNLGVSTSDMSTSTIGSQLSTRNLGTQLSSRDLMDTGARQMSNRGNKRQLSRKQLSTRQLSSRQLSGRQLQLTGVGGRQLSSRQLSNRGLMSMSRCQNFDLLGGSELSLDALSISGHSKQLSRKNVFMDQYMAMDMGLSDFSLGSLPEASTHTSAKTTGNAHHARPSVIIEGDLEGELSEHSRASLGIDTSISNTNANNNNINWMDQYAAVGTGTSISNMTMNSVGTFSGHSRMSRGLYATGHSMRLESGHSFLAANDLQLDMLDDELFDEYDYMDDADEFSSEFC